MSNFDIWTFETASMLGRYGSPIVVRNSDRHLANGMLIAGLKALQLHLAASR
jgi:hypothetical protein